MMNAGEYDIEVKSIIENISSNCEFCKRYKKTKARPVACLPTTKKFSDVVAMPMDLKQFHNVYFISLTCLLDIAKLKLSKKKHLKLLSRHSY